MQMTKLIAVAATVVLAGCAAQVKPMTTPSGKQGFLVSCDGSADDWTSCYAAATNACKGTYKAIDRNESSMPSQYGPIIRRYMIAECS